MSWLLNTFKSDVPDSSESPRPSSPEHAPSTTPGGVKDDLSVLGQTLGRQLRGVANFLAPPPPPAVVSSDPSSLSSSSSQSQAQALLGIRNDLVEIGGSFRTGLALLSSNKAVSEISRLASNLLQFEEDKVRDEEASGEDDDDDNLADDEVGVTDEILDFATEISTRPELWTDFPITLDDDFSMSDAQREHASTVEHLTPSLAALRVKLQNYMSEEQFWMIYFILLLPRFSEDDFELLATSKIVEARQALLQKLQKNALVESDSKKTLDTSQGGSKAGGEPQGDNISSERKEASTDVSSVGVEMADEENSKKCLEKEHINAATSVRAQKKVENEDISFSDLEDEDNDLSSRSSRVNSGQETKVSSPSGCSNDWVQLQGSSETQGGGGQQKEGQSNSRDKDSSGEESNDWLTVDDFD